jgi:hemoglobin/transferrin/lactoferrin receptor protein
MKKTKKTGRGRPGVLAVSVALACAAAGPAGAQVVARSLPQVVVSASRQEQLSDDLPLSLDVLDRDDLERGQVQDIRDAARDLPNVSVRHAPSRFALTGPANSTGRDGNAGFTIRGLGGNRVLMLVDGIRVPRSYAFGGNAFGRDYLAIDLVKRIEVVRGAASALYGSDGMAGLVNFVTYEPRDFLRTDAGEPRRIGGRAAATWSGDDQGLGLTATVAGQASEAMEWLVTLSGRLAHGADTMGGNDSLNVDRTRPNPQTDNANAVLGKIVLRPGAGQKHVLTLEHVGRRSEVELLSSRAPLPLTGTATQVASAVLDERGSMTMARDRLTWEGRFQLHAALADDLLAVVGAQNAASRQLGTSDLNARPDRLRDVSYSERTWQAGLQAGKTTPPAGNWSRHITYGFDHVQSRITNLYTGLNSLPPEVFPLKRFPDTREQASALYAQVDWSGDAWSIVPGVRLDRFSLAVLSQEGFSPPSATPGRSLSGSAVSPKLGVIYRATPAWSVFGNYAGGFRAPNANQVNGYYENVGEQVLIVANPDLKPEKSRTYELGLRGRMARLSVDVAAFSGRFSSLIVDNVLIGGTGVAGDPKRFQTLNTDRARIHGFEVKGVLQLGQLAGGSFSAPFAYGRARGVNSNTGQPLNAIDPAQLSLGLDYRSPAWDLRLDVRHVAGKGASEIDSPSLVKAPNTQITTPASTSVDLSGQWRIRKDLRLTASVVNLTNRKYWLWSDVQGLAASTRVADAYTQPGRHARVSLVADF